MDVANESARLENSVRPTFSTGLIAIPTIAFEFRDVDGAPTRSNSGLPPEKWSSLKYGFRAD
jgi:hypothetical protein